MPGTIELTNKKMMEKIETIKLVFEQIKCLLPIIESYGVNHQEILSANFIHINLIVDNFDDLESTYNLRIVHILTAYYSNSLNSYTEDNITKEFYQIINAENFLPRMDEYVKKAEVILNMLITAYLKVQRLEIAKIRKRIVSKAATSDRLDRDDVLTPIVEKIKKHIDYAKSIVVQIEVKKSNYEICICGERMTLLPISSELACKGCQIVRAVPGTSSDDQDAFGSDKGNSKHGKYDPNRHFRYWMERIQAKQPKVFPPEHISKMENIIEKNSIELNTVQDMREVLREAKLTTYNDFAPLLMKIFTGRSPPQLTFAVLRRFSIKFNKIIEYLEKIKSPEGNRPYYPFFIYKIIEDEIERAKARGEYSELGEFKRMLLYIHLQSSDTVSKHDESYKAICELSVTESEDPEEHLIFRPTNKEYQRF